MQGPVILSRSHADALGRFLQPTAESSLVLLSNARFAGLEDHGRILEGTYAAFIQGGEITGVAAHYWNGMVFLQAPENAPLLVRAVITASGRHCSVIAGPYDQVQKALPGFIDNNRKPAMNGRDTLYSLDLDSFRSPICF